MFPRDHIRITFTVMHYQVFEHYDTLSFAFLVCIILYIDSKQFRCSVFTFVQYTCIMHLLIVNILSQSSHVTRKLKGQNFRRSIAVGQFMLEKLLK